MSDESQQKVPKTDDDLKQFAADYYDSKIFTSDMIHNPREIGMVFMPLLLGAFKDYTKEQLADIGVIYEYISKAGPRSINGMPIFFSLCWLTKGETERANVFLKQYSEFKEAFLKKEET